MQYSSPRSEVSVSANVRHSHRYLLLISATLMTPGLLIAAVLWHSFSEQLDASRERQLHNNLQIFELMLDQELSAFRNALTRLAADDRLQVTVDQETLPQLRRYLESQMQISNLLFLTLANGDAQKLIELGEQPRQQQFHCGATPPNNTEEVFLADSQFHLSRIQPLIRSGRPLGYLCGGFAIGGTSFISAVSARLDGQPTLAIQGRSPDLTLNPLLPDPLLPARTVYLTQDHGRQAIGIYGNFPLGSESIAYGVLIDLAAQQLLSSSELLIFSLVLIALLSAAGYGMHMLSLQHDAEQALQHVRERAMVILNSIADAVVSTDTKGRIVYLNPAAAQLIGIEEASAIGADCYDVLDIRSDRSKQKLLYMLHSPEIDPHANCESDAVLITPGGHKTAVHLSVARVQGSGLSAGRVIVLRNMGHEHELKRRLAWKASRDDLTGLLNRSEFRRSVANAIETAQTNRDATQGLIYIDLDEFKIVNDTCGHQAGDRLLKQVSALLLSQTRKGDTVARLGGDEFGLLLADCDIDEAIKIAEGLIDSINDIRFSFLNKVFHVGASMGLVRIDQNTCDLEDLLATVDAACYAAKEQGRNKVFVGQVDDRKIIQRMEELNQASRIRHALRDDRLLLFCQPIVDTESPLPHQQHHREILVRMLDRKGGVIAPGAFIPIAERTGLMRDVDRWIIHQLFQTEGAYLRHCFEMQQQRAGRRSTFVYTINLSGASLVDPSFLEFVKSEMAEYAIPPETIGFEITETQVITHLDKAINFMTELKKLGCSFLLDDFGSGMSSFGYLKNLPVDYLKIDGQFVKDICSDPIDFSMVKAINEIGHVMGLKTIAEYVENDEILHSLQQIGVDMAQGYGIAPPQRLLPSCQPLEQDFDAVAKQHYSSVG
ncbi:MAG: EAL domain-containing protein [Gammaproteobacteria bacterium]|nr:EAL domain-containing protein [Gammaproteobacteria bacterium]MCP5417951.1 EAL domain-containing protein [Chromatiaceae bacterium]